LGDVVVWCCRRKHDSTRRRPATTTKIAAGSVTSSDQPTAKTPVPQEKRSGYSLPPPLGAFPQVRGLTGVEVAGIELVPTVGTRRIRLVASTTRRFPAGPIGSRWVRLLTPSTAPSAARRRVRVEANRPPKGTVRNCHEASSCLHTSKNSRTCSADALSTGRSPSRNRRKVRNCSARTRGSKPASTSFAHVRSSLLV